MTTKPVTSIYGQSNYSDYVYSWAQAWLTKPCGPKPLDRKPGYTPPPKADWQPVECKPLTKRVA